MLVHAYKTASGSAGLTVTPNFGASTRGDNTIRSLIHHYCRERVRLFEFEQWKIRHVGQALVLPNVR